jgi:hypothetical protein
MERTAQRQSETNHKLVHDSWKLMGGQCPLCGAKVAEQSIKCINCNVQWSAVVLQAQANQATVRNGQWTFFDNVLCAVIGSIGWLLFWFAGIWIAILVAWPMLVCFYNYLKRNGKLG